MTIQGPLPPVAGHLRVILKYQRGGNPAGGSRFHMNYSGVAPSGPDLQTFINKVGGTWGTNMSAVMSVGTGLLSATVIDIASDTGNTATWTTGAAGTRPGGESPVSQAALVNMKIPRHYRGGKPRMYVLAGADTDCTDGKNWTSTFQSDFTGAFQIWQFGLLGQYGAFTTLSWRAISYYANSIPNDNPSQWAPKNVPKQRDSPISYQITGFSLNPVVSTQRKRLKAR